MPPVSVPELLELRAREDPDHIALLVQSGPTLTYEAWERRSNAIARAMIERGVRSGDRVALYFDNSRWIDYAACYIAAQKAGAAAVPLSPRFAPAELAAVLDNAGPALLVSSSVLPAPTSFAAGAVLEDLERSNDTGPINLAVADGLAEIIYTSGTTGRARGVACTHRNILVHDLPPDTGRPGLFLHAFPIGTNAGQECVRMPLRRTATAVVLAAFDPEQLCAAIAEHRVRRLQLVPSMAALVVDSRAPSRHDVSSVERIILSSAPAPAPLWDRLAAAFPTATLWNAYALTEGGAARTLTQYDPSRPSSVGRPVGETEVRIVSEHGADAAPGERGEVWLRRRGAPRREYFRDPDATAAAFSGDWLRTGDTGYLDAGGSLTLVDRAKDVIITGGLNVASLEVEQALAAHPDVADVAVFAVPHDVLGQDVAAAVVLRTPAGVRDLQAFVRSRLGEHKTPHRIVIVDALPRNASGKVVKRELRERYGARPAAATAPAAPSNDIERTIHDIWREVLGEPELGVHDDFFERGGQSLAATHVAARVSDSFGVELPATAVFEHPTVAELAATVAGLLGGVAVL